ncbi:hypothetical protein BDQ17DRAFT_1386072 [Cyathus striatus]|nr:hypothetical protein BDQ17DRAFT_1386072 [Cyathus striatus]
MPAPPIISPPNSHPIPSIHSSPDPPSAPSRPPPPSPSRSNTLYESHNTSLQSSRRARHRSVEVRSNRLSGFFTNFIHRRDHPPISASRETNREDGRGDINNNNPPSRTPSHASEPPSRTASPPPTRSVTPPPSLPPPTLQELGLSLSVVTSDLSPSHFTTPPASGAFLAPHYLLLCHAQGLDVLPLVSPPAPQPYALVRRVSFKSVVVMEQRGVLVAIAGRRDGVRVYALEEVKKAIEWRIDVEVRRERDRARRENLKKITIRSLDGTDTRDSPEKTRKASLSTPPPGEVGNHGQLLRKSSYNGIPTPPSPPPVPMIPRSATPRAPKKPRIPSLQIPPSQLSDPSGHPPPYISPVEAPQPPDLLTQPSAISVSARARGASINEVFTAPPVSRRNTEVAQVRVEDAKEEWAESSDDEAIDIVAAGSSGSQALDERTSATFSAGRQISSNAVPSVLGQPISSPPRTSIGTSRRSRPSNLDLSLIGATPSAPPPEPSPAPTLLTLRQALSHSPGSLTDTRAEGGDTPDPDTPFGDVEEDDDDDDGRISLAQALLESRIPDLPPVGTRQPQQPILITSSHPVAAPDDEPSSPRTSEGHRSLGRQPNVEQSTRRRRRWSVMIGSPSDSTHDHETTPRMPSTAPLMSERDTDRPSSRLIRSHSFRSNHSSATYATESQPVSSGTAVPPLPQSTPSIMSTQSSRSSRFISRIISNAFHSRRSEDRPQSANQRSLDTDHPKRSSATQPAPPAPPPKLEYVKLPGTKNALMVKAVETAKKSFLAILCGENGEKVELFAGTYRTALGLSRTFILPDSPRSLELQLQGDDLVEVFLVFSQNVFGLEPATVRVREVRIGRAERRAARRRAREARAEGNAINEGDGPEDDTNVNVSIGVSVAVGSNIVATGDGPEQPATPPLVANEHPEAQNERSSSPIEVLPSTTTAHPEELVAVATASMGPYTTFQQLSFAPNFPLASIADEYIIPPTYPDFLEYRSTYEGAADGDSMALTQMQFSPPGLPIPTPAAPCRWYYRDPKGVVHGPWKASLMHAWYKDGFLPPDLPVRREEDGDYMLLKDLRLQCVDPTQPFKSPSIVTSETKSVCEEQSQERPLLQPISLLSQPKHFGPPALFYSSRGGHSTAIVDARGRSVLKGRFIWSNDGGEQDTKPAVSGKMGDVKRLEAFDVHDRSVLVAMRQGGLEAVDLSDALLKPADASRTAFPYFQPSQSLINRRAPFVWKIGTPINSSSGSATALTSKGKGGSSHLTGKRMGIGSTKSSAGRTDTSMGDADSEHHDEVLFLGRKDDEMYICERNAGSFRILRLCPDPANFR